MSAREFIDGGIALLMGLFAAQEQPEYVLHRFGYVESVANRAVIEEAISKANILLPQDRGMQLVPAWQLTAIPKDKVTVFWVGGKNLTPTPNDMIFVPGHCRCVIAQAPAYFRWFERYRSRMDNLSAENVLAYFLLHEAGHIDKEHPGRGISDASGNFNTTPTVSKQREDQADQFAADLIRTAVQDTSNFDRLSAGGWVSIALSDLSFAITGNRVIGNFGGSTLNRPSLFLDDGSSHPNFELRILRVNHQIQSTATSKQLLDDFLERRRSAEAPGAGVLFRKR